MADISLLNNFCIILRNLEASRWDSKLTVDVMFICTRPVLLNMNCIFRKSAIVFKFSIW